MKGTRWVEPFRYTPGEPFRIMPLGEFKRGGRTLNITPERLKEIADNHAAGRPRWEVPIYFGHPGDGEDPPKRGNIKRVFYKDGDGLYAEPEYNDDAKAALAKGEYQFISPGIFWTLGGSKYVDDKGVEHDNTLDHIAFTNKPFFGRNTQIFSADSELVAEDDPAVGAVKMLLDALRSMVGAGRDVYAIDDAMQAKMSKMLDAMPEDERAEMKKKMAGMSGEELENHIKEMTAKMSSKTEGADTMADTTQTTTTTDTTAATTTVTVAGVAPEKFAALEQQNQELTDKLTAQKAEMDKFAEQLRAEKRARRQDQLLDRYEGFSAISEKPETLAEKFMALEEKDPELSKYFDTLLETLDTQIKQSGLFSQIADARPGNAGAETLETFADKLLKDKFGGDEAKFAEAFRLAGQMRPDLKHEYIARPSGR